jgi:meiotically up-regulated gene 157 (Mug157) protein
MKKRYYPTGNEYIALPTIAENGAIESINYLSMQDRGVIELTGDPFLLPVLTINGETVPMDHAVWKWESYWIPTFTIESNGVRICGKYIAPQHTKGFFLRIEVETDGEMPEMMIGINGNFGEILHSINESKPVQGSRQVYHSLWNQGLVFDFRTGVTMFSFAFLTEDGFDQQSWNEEKSVFSLEKKVKWISGKSGSMGKVDLFMGIGLEEVGAVTQAIHMQRETGDHLYQQLKDWLDGRTLHLYKDHVKQILNVNQFFNYFYATGKTLDTEERILCTSRSPRYYVSAAYWDRDSLIWSFPALLLTEAETAKEALEYVFTRQIKNIGVHSRYIDGVVLEPGFEMDELCAPLLALDQYLDATNDWAFVEDHQVKKGLDLIWNRMMGWKHQEIDLFGTFLMPTDDMRVYPYLTYNNVLVWKALQIFEKIDEKLGNRERQAGVLAERVKQAIWSHMIVELDGKKVFCWSADLEGQSDFYDEPPGSLTMFSYYGFVEAENEVLQNTKARLYSSAFDHYFEDSSFQELGCSHADHPWILSICNSLLNGRKVEALEMLSRSDMDNTIACESIDEETGEWATGAHFATCAGFLVHALVVAGREDGE